MNRTASNRRLAFALVAILLPGLPAAFAAGGAESPVLETPLPNAPGLQLKAITVTYAPGAKSRPHVHDASVFVYVLSGTVRSRIAGQPVHLYRAGESWFEPPGTHHLVSENASESEPARLLVVFVARPEAALTHSPGQSTPLHPGEL
jgi:quercetin dioxygenase-like cupin family protein